MNEERPYERATPVRTSSVRTNEQRGPETHGRALWYEYTRGVPQRVSRPPNPNEMSLRWNTITINIIILLHQ